MEEKPKSIWKKSWTGWRGLLLGWLLLTATLAVIFFIWLATMGRPAAKSGDEIRLFGAVWLGVTVIFLLAAFIRWLFCWHNFKRFLFGLACFATLIALFYAEENWRGKHDWEKFKREWEAKGERFDWQSIVPPTVPDEQNFALTPVVASSYGMFFDTSGHETFPRNTNIVDRLSMITWRDNRWAYAPKSESWQNGKKTDLKAWQEYFRLPPPTNSTEPNSFPIAPQPQTPSADILLALSKYDSAINEISAASRLEYSRFPLTYEKQLPFDILLPHLAALRSCAQALGLRALAELQNGQNEKAVEDVKLSLYLTSAIHAEPFEISHLVRIAILQMVLQPIYEGLAEHQWSDAQLVELNSELAKLDFLADYKTSMRGARAALIAGLEFLRHTHNLAPLFHADGQLPEWMQIASRLTMPNAFFYQNELTIARMHQQYTLPMVNVEKQTVSPVQVHNLQAEANQELNHYWPYKIFAKILLSEFQNAVKQFAYAQASVDLARTAIALERYRLAHGEYPQSLNALAPQFIAQVPHDVIGGQPLKYRLESDGQFVLYSIGWNERDDGGVIFIPKNGTQPKFEEGDWVWKYPVK
jgi:hypothetical protein